MGQKHIPGNDSLQGTGLTRRDFLRIMGLGSLTVTASSLLAAYSPESIAASAPDKSAVWANWPLSIDTTDDGTIPSLVEFKKRYGISVTYNAAINDNNQYFAKIKPLMEKHEHIGADLISPTGWMAGIMIANGWIQKLDDAHIKTARANLLKSDVFQHPSFDPHRTYSMPWQGWMAGIGVNTEVTGRDVRSLKDFFTAKDLKGRVGVLNELPESGGLLLLYTGANPAHFNDAQFEKAMGVLTKAREDGQILRVTGNNYAPQLAQGNLAACFGWAGDIMQLHRDNPKIKFFIPEEGAMLTQDQLLIPKYISAEKKAIAEKVIDYYFEPQVAAQVAKYVNAVCPVAGAQEAMEKLDPDLATNQLIFPDSTTQKRLHGFMALPDSELKARQSQFERALGL